MVREGTRACLKPLEIARDLAAVVLLTEAPDILWNGHIEHPIQNMVNGAALFGGFVLSAYAIQEDRKELRPSTRSMYVRTLVRSLGYVAVAVSAQLVLPSDQEPSAYSIG